MATSQTKLGALKANQKAYILTKKGQNANQTNSKNTSLCRKHFQPSLSRGLNTLSYALVIEGRSKIINPKSRVAKMWQSTEIKNRINKNLRNVTQIKPRVSSSQSPVSCSLSDLEWGKQVTCPSISSFNVFGRSLHFTPYHELLFFKVIYLAKQCRFV